MAALELARQQTEKDRKIVGLNEDRVRLAESETTKTFEAGTKRFSNNDLPQYVASQPVRVTPIKLKGVALLVFLGDGKMEYEPWKAAFMSVVDEAQKTVKEKMLRLQDSLSGRALRMVKDLGYSENAYARAKEKLESKFRGKRRI